MTQPAVYQAYDLAGRRKYLNGKEGKLFLKAAAALPPRERLLCEALYYLGCRPSEAIRLTKEQVEKSESLVRIFSLKKRGKVVTRRVPIPRELAQALLRLETADDGRLWPISRMGGWRIVKPVMASAGIKGIQATSKGLRHGFGVRAALAGVPLNIIQRWMGHARSSTTAIYLDIKDDEERKLMTRMWR